MKKTQGKKTRKPGSGGARSGAGAKRLAEEVFRKNVVLDRETIKFMILLGEGNLSRGIRNAAQKLRILAGY